ncbi:DUF732 domain-containing protein [Herbiconiux sp. KACC 21604]|uniref:DUF732 domain-containing protein n=1 Tax=unclassified Herbiconiux TaxID=2618217 RepID=UPI001492AEB5|nr:DUF732 domain-containing protein [Herbiconiux sp. SALV-R1]QJU52923.1 DUF732 domain-containing protein [Herbiconiux sp. SALV-R1]WPO87843.1 DUF732 domain-containing protein [Herbiconiux sp. KACC 21604]
MRKLGGVAVLVAVLAVSGCSAGAESTQTVSTAETGAQPSAAPITMEPQATPTESASPYGEYTQDEFFVRSVSALWVGDLPDDGAIVAAGAEACAQLSSGTAKDAVLVVTGDDPNAADNNFQVVKFAINVYCPEFDS